MGKLQQVYNKWDFFASPIEGLHLHGKQEIGTSIGCLFSVLTTIIVLLYASVRAKIVFLEDGRPKVSISELKGNYEDQKVDLRKGNLRFIVSFFLFKGFSLCCTSSRPVQI